jgi:uncharacterized protein
VTLDSIQQDVAPERQRRSRREGERGGAPRRVWLDWEPGSTSLRGWRWAALIWAAATTIVALGLAFALAQIVGGELGRTIGWAVYAVSGAAVAAVFLLRSAPRGLFRLRAVDVVFGIVAGMILPFAAGAWTSSAGVWPALGALSPRWLVFGVAVPVVAAALAQLFANAFLLVAVYSVLRRTGTSRMWARVAAGAAGAVALIAPALLLAGDLSRQPLALPLALAVVSAATVVVSGRIWGAVLLAVVFQLLWVALSLAGTVLA